MALQKKRFIVILLSIQLLLLIPFIAMQFTNEVNWSAMDFLVMEMLLLTVSFLIEFLIRKVKIKKYRIGFIFLVLSVFLLIWAELAVGILGTPFAGS